MYTHILIHCNSESNAEQVYALCDGQSRMLYRAGRFIEARFPITVLANMRPSRVAPRVVRLDRIGNRDIDFAQLRQYLGPAWGLVEWMQAAVDEREGLTS